MFGIRRSPSGIGDMKHSVLTGRLIVEAAAVDGYGADPVPNLLIVNVAFEDGRPVTGLTAENFGIFNYAYTNGQAYHRKADRVTPLADEVKSPRILGVYKVEPEAEPELVQQRPEQRVGVTAYVVVVWLTADTDEGRVSYTGQTVLSVVMQPRPI